MKSILLVGLGRFGTHTAMKLDELGHQVLAIDINEERASAAEDFVTDIRIGDSTNPAVIEELGVGNFDVCIVAIGDNFQNSLQTTSLLKEMGAQLVVSRASSDVHAKFLLRNGADRVVYPEKQLAHWTAMTYSSEHIFDYIELQDGYAIFEVDVPENWVGKTIGQINIRKRYNVHILSLKKNGRMDMVIDSDTRFEGDETMLVLGKNQDIYKCFHI